MTSSLRPCLYCESITNPRTREHILQDRFGTNWSLTEDVCGDCNTKRFSHLDHELFRSVRTLVYWDHPDVLRRTILQDEHALWFNDQRGIWISLRIRQDGKRAIFPQLIFRTNTEFLFLTDEANNPVPFERIKSELRQPEKLAIEAQLVDSQSENLPEVQPAIIRSAPNTYLIRASSQKDVHRIKDMISRGVLFDAIPREEKKFELFPQPTPVQIDITIKYDHVERALAKSALNFLCAAVGSEVARYDCFSEIRRFVLGEYPAALGAFVMPLWDRDRDQHADNFCSLFSREGYHTLVLWEVDGFPLVFFLLYSRPFAVVRLFKEPHTPILGTEGTRIAFFDYKSKTHTLQTLGDYMPDFCDQLSQTFGQSNILDSAAARRAAENQAWDKLKTKLGGS